MAANTQPRFTVVDNVSWGKISGVDGSTDGTDADVVLIFTAEATDGSLIEKLNCTPRSTSGSTTTSAATIRVYINNGSTVGTGTNNVLYTELSVPAAAVDVAGVLMVPTYVIPLDLRLPPGYRIYVGVTAMAANTNWDVTGVGGDY